MPVQLLNNASSTLASAISDTDVELSLASGGGANFPSITSPDFFYITVVGTAGNLEIMKVTARAGDVLSITRAQDGTNASAFSAGSLVEMRINVASITDYVDNQLRDAENITYTNPLTGAVETNVEARLSERVSVKDFGAVGDGVTDDTAAIQAAIDAVEAAGGGEVYFPANTYRCDSTLNIDASGVRLSLSGSTLDFSNLPITTTSSVLAVGVSIDGSAGTPISVTADVSAKDTQLTVASTAGISAGDTILLSSSQLYMDGVSGSEIRQEILTVESVVDGTTLDIEGMVRFSYLSASSAQITPITTVDNVSVTDGTITMGGVGSGHDAIRASYTEDLLVRDCVISKGEDVNVWVRYSQGTVVERCRIEEATDPSFITTGYGVSFTEASNNCVVQDCSFLNNRHHVTGGTMAINVRVLNNWCGESSDAALDCHEPNFWWTFDGNHIDANNNKGIGVRGQYCTVTNNTVLNSSNGTGILIQSFDTNPSGQSRIVVQGNRVEDCRAGILLTGTSARIKDSVVCDNIVRNCELGSIQLNECTRVQCDDNIVDTATDTGTSGSGIRLVGTSFSANCTDITLSGNTITDTQYYGIWLDYAQRCVLSDNRVTNTLRNAVRIEESEDIQLSGGFYEPGSSITQAAYLLNSTRVQITGGHFQYTGVDSNRDGIYVNGSSDVAVTGNIIDGMTRYGLFATGSSLVSSSNNKVHTCTTPFGGDIEYKGGLSVKDYGAKGDGTTDDTAAIQAAIDAVEAAGGGSVFIPAGTYRTTSTLDATDRNNALRIYGEGKYASYLYGDFTGPSDAVLDVSYTDNAERTLALTLEGFSVRANGVLGDPIGIKAMRAMGMTIRDIFVPGDLTSYGGLANTNLFMTQVNNCQVIDCHFAGGYQPDPFPMTDGTTFSGTASGTTLTASASVFTASMAGESIIVSDGGPSGDSTAYHYTTIASYTSGTSVELTDAFSQTFTGAYASVGIITGSITSGTNTLTLDQAAATSSLVGMGVYLPRAANKSDGGSPHGLLATTVSGYTNSTTLTLTDNATATQLTGVPVYFAPAVFVGSTEAEYAETRQTNDCSFSNVQIEGFKSAGAIVNRAIALYFDICKFHGEGITSQNDFARSMPCLVMSDVLNVSVTDSPLSYGCHPEYGQIYITGSRGQLVLSGFETYGLLKDAPIVALDTDVNAACRVQIDNGWITDGVAKHSENWKPWIAYQAGNVRNVGKDGYFSTSKINVRIPSSASEFTYTPIVIGGSFDSSADHLTIEDDAVTKFFPPRSFGTMVLSGSGAEIGAMILYRTSNNSAGAYTLELAGGTVMAVTTGDLTGTTGSDGFVTVSAGTDGSIQIENRRGFQIKVAYSILATGHA